MYLTHLSSLFFLFFFVIFLIPLLEFARILKMTRKLLRARDELWVRGSRFGKVICRARIFLIENSNNPCLPPFFFQWTKNYIFFKIIFYIWEISKVDELYIRPETVYHRTSASFICFIYFFFATIFSCNEILTACSMANYLKFFSCSAGLFLSRKFTLLRR